MDIPDYNCGARQEENKSDKLTNPYMISMDSGFDSIYSGCASVLIEKSLSRESFDIFSPKATNLTPIKQSPSALKYHVSTPKSSAPIKRHLYSTFTSSLKRSKSENSENEPTNIVRTCVLYKRDPLNDSSCPFKELHNYDFSPRKNILSSTTNYHQSFDNDSMLSFSKYSSLRCEEEPSKQDIVPERPSKCVRYVAPLVKHSKRKLDIPPVDKEKTDRIYFHGTRFLNIIAKLEQFPLALDHIFKNLNSKDLLNVSLVSRKWNSIVKSNRCANARIKQYLNESHNLKENLKESSKPAITLNRRHPFSQFNMISTSKKPQDSSHSSSFYENQNVVQQLLNNERLVKCPRCGKGSIISDSLARLNSTDSCLLSRTTSSDSMLLNKKTNSIYDAKARQYSIDEDLPPQASEGFGACTSLACKYLFCPKCLCDYHPGVSCQLTGPESPSKLIVCHKKSKAENKPHSKLVKRQSLRRLCFS